MTLNKQAIKKAAITAVVRGFNAALVIGGIACAGYGIWQVYEPAAYVFVGVAMVWMGLPDKSGPAN